MDKTSNNKRIAKNTMLLYVRMIVLMFVQLYTVPVILNALGTEDYGIYNVTAGVVTMFSFIGGSLASGSQRFLSFELGRNDEKKLKSVFNTTLSIYLIIAVGIFIVLELAGTLFLNYKMTVPPERMEAANWVLQSAIVAFLFSLANIPFTAAVIAHERMNLFAYISIVECFVKLGIAMLLPLIHTDRLTAYAIMICSAQLLILLSYVWYCRRNFAECRHLRFSLDPALRKDLLSYSGWNMIGSIAMISRMQGINIIMNLFFGPLLNAAHAIAQQINGALNQFINNVYMATRPQITKLYAARQTEDMWQLIFVSSKFAYYLLMLLSIPLLIETQTILALWLHNVPRLATEISRLMIATILVETLSNQVIAAYQAANKIRKYQISSSTILLCNIPISYVMLLAFPENALLPYVVSVGLSVLFSLSILWNAKRQIGFDIKRYSKEVLARVISVYLITFALVEACVSCLTPGFTRIIVSIILTIGISVITIGSIGISPKERTYIYGFIKKKFLKSK